MRSDQLGLAQKAVKAIKAVSVWVLVLVLLLFAAALYLAAGERRTTLRNIGWAFILVGLHRARRPAVRRELRRQLARRRRSTATRASGVADLHRPICGTSAGRRSSTASSASSVPCSQARRKIATRARAHIAPIAEREPGDRLGRRRVRVPAARPVGRDPRAPHPARDPLARRPARGRRRRAPPPDARRVPAQGGGAAAAGASACSSSREGGGAMRTDRSVRFLGAALVAGLDDPRRRVRLEQERRHDHDVEHRRLGQRPVQRALDLPGVADLRREVVDGESLEVGPAGRRRPGEERRPIPSSPRPRTSASRTPAPASRRRRRWTPSRHSSTTTSSTIKSASDSGLLSGISTASATLATAQKQITTAFDQLKGLDPKGELGDAFSQASSCSSFTG